jgi:hypothetical protein
LEDDEKRATRAGLREAPSKFELAPGIAYEVIPVVDSAEGVGLLSAGVAFRDSV